MDGTHHIIGEVVRRCKASGVDVSETLAAFIARAVMMEDMLRYQLDKELNEEDLNSLINTSFDRLVSKDSPSLETIKMQVAFDTSYVEQQEEMEEVQGGKDKQQSALIKDVLEVRSKNDSDFEALTTLYRRIFTFLMVRTGTTEGQDRAVEREVAAALESVFPRVGLNAFMALTAQEKASQLKELSKIVLGIRLFNKDIGKGGIGLIDLASLVPKLSHALDVELQGEIDEQSDLTQQYVEVINYLHAKGSNFSAEGEIQLKRMQEELTNRRQYLSYLQSLQEDLAVSIDRLEKTCASFSNEMVELRGQVGSRTSVPKEQVYPRFITMANLHEIMSELQQIIHARAQTLQTLREYRVSFNPVLRPSFVEEARQATDVDVSKAVKMAAGSLGASKGEEEGAEEDVDAQLTDDMKPVLIPCDSSPEFLQLPLEYQGFCPWTIMHRGGLLLPGNPALGVVRFRNRHYTVVSDWAIEAFMLTPDRYVNAVLATAKKAPELIHLLRLQEYFPEAAITRLIKGTRGMDGDALILGSAIVRRVDTGTQTPVHIVQQNYDYKYEWNEWALRRRALHLANIRMKKTHSVQTIMSHFRRENESQTYLPKEKGTQSLLHTATNVPRKRNYIKGLRGFPAESKVTVQFTHNPI